MFCYFFFLSVTFLWKSVFSLEMMIGLFIHLPFNPLNFKIHLDVLWALWHISSFVWMNWWIFVIWKRQKLSVIWVICGILVILPICLNLKGEPFTWFSDHFFHCSFVSELHTLLHLCHWLGGISFSSFQFLWLML